MTNRADLLKQAEAKHEREQLIVAAEAKHASENKEEKYSLPTIIEQAGNVISGGYLPQMKAGIESMLPDDEARAYLNAPIVDVFDPTFREKAAKLDGQGKDKSYVQLRDQYIKTLQKQKEEQPIASKIGMGAGMVGSALSIPSKMFGAATTLKGALGAGAASGAAYSALSNPGDVEGVVNPTQFGERAFNATIGAGLGAAGGAAGLGVSKAMGAIPDNLQKFAGERAYKALGRGTKKEAERLGEEGVQQVGQTALKEGIIGVIPKGRQALSESVEAGLQKVGDELGKSIDDLAVAESKLIKKGLNVATDSKDIADQLVEGLVDTSAAGSKAFNKAVLDRADELIEFSGGGPIGIKDLQALKEKLGNKIDWGTLKIKGKLSLPERQQIDLELYNILSKETLEQADTLASSVGGPMSSKMKDLRSLYSKYKEMQKLTDSESARELTNRIISPSDIATGGLGAILSSQGSQNSDPLSAAGIGLALAGGHKFARQYGSQVAARGASSLANKIGGVVSKSQSLLQPARAGLMANEYKDILSNYEKYKNKAVSQQQAADMFQQDNK